MWAPTDVRVPAIYTQDGSSSAAFAYGYRKEVAADCGGEGRGHLLGSTIWLGNDPGKTLTSVFLVFLKACGDVPNRPEQRSPRRCQFYTERSRNIKQVSLDCNLAFKW